jgi:hypothetical protein
MNSETVKQHIQELEQLRRQTRRFRRLTMVALVVIVVAGVSAIVKSFYELTLVGPKQEAFVKHLNVSLHRDLLPVVQQIAGRSLERLKPAVEVELQQLNARAPEIAEVALRELDQLGSELPVRAEQILDQTVGVTMKRREARLRLMYPDIYDRQIETLLDNLAAEAEDQIAATSDRIFAPHLNSIHSILDNLEKIQNTEPLAATQPVDSWQMAFLFLDVFVHEFKDLSVTDTAKPKEMIQ